MRGGVWIFLPMSLDKSARDLFKTEDKEINRRGYGEHGGRARELALLRKMVTNSDSSELHKNSAPS